VFFSMFWIVVFCVFLDCWFFCVFGFFCILWIATQILTNPLAMTALFPPPLQRGLGGGYPTIASIAGQAWQSIKEFCHIERVSAEYLYLYFEIF
ncbi:hypothetical protein, partial [Helicobacter sp. T3_23-1059]